MPLGAGAHLGQYEIVSALGAGGMGEVYRGRDTKLQRDVALKILPDTFKDDPERLARFRREAQVLASLNHPHIGAIYGLDEAGGRQFLVLELVEGTTLDKRIATRPIPVDEALSIGRQIAEALEAAHDKGIIHRDLKPANIALTRDGKVKVLDFGLAKPTEAAKVTFDQTNSPTITSAAMMTGAGVILGTAAYMSPEQARGTPVGEPTDIWSFGCVVYEMLAARPAFHGETVQDTIAKILEREPNWKALPVTTPAKLRQLLHRCLQKDPRKRLHHIGDARIEIEDALAAKTTLRQIGAPLGLALGVAMLIALIVALWSGRRPSRPAEHAPVSVLIADIDNHTADPTFDRALESMLKLELEGAGFISAYDRTGVRTLGAPAPEQFGEQKTQEIAIRQGVGIVVAGSLTRDHNEYQISLKAIHAVTGDVITSTTNRAAGKDQVLPAVMKAAVAIRQALGDQTSDARQIFAKDTLSATSLDAVRRYALGTEALSNARFEEALQHFSRAVQLDPNFGMGYQGMALASRNLDRQDAAEQYIKEALRHLDGMTERERYRARGFFYRVTGDYHACVREYGELLARYAADVAGHNQIALCSTFLRNMPKAVAEMSEAVKVVPKSTILQNNLALYRAYSSDFQGAEKEARAIERPGVNSLIALAFGQLGQGHAPEALETYRKLEVIDAQGLSRAASGFGDVALYEGRFAEAVRILAQGASADLKGQEPNRAAAKFAALAYAELSRSRSAAAIAAAESALKNSRTVKIRFLAGRVLAEAGATDNARTVAASLASELESEPRAHAKIIEALLSLKGRDAGQAISTLTEASNLLDTWIGHFDLGRAYLEAGRYIQSDSEFDRCLKRRGEALSLFLDEEPTYGYLPPVYYYQGRVREALNSTGFAESYGEYLKIRGNSSEDPLVTETSRHAADSSSRSVR